MLKLFTILSSILLYNAFLFGQVFNISPSSLNFGNVVLGSSSTLQTTISNPDTIDLVINGITSSNGEFIFTPNTFPDTITAGGSQIFDVTFTPTVTGLLAGTLTITHNASGSPTVYSVQGTGVAAGFSISPASLSFGNVVLGSSSTLQTTISNPGTSDLVISGISSSATQFTFSPNVFPVTITAGGSQVFDVTFTPTVTGLLSGTLTITHNAAGSPTVYSVQGIGIEAFSSSLNLLNLVNVITSSIVDTQFTVTNNGTVPLLMNTNITDAPNWNISPDTVLIPAGSNFIFTLTFSAPAMPTTFADTLTLSTVGFPSLRIPLSANVVSDAGIIFELDSVYKLEDNSYMEIMQLKNLTDSLHAFQFRIQVNKEISDNVILIFQNIQKGTDVADASWILRSTITRGPITPNGASMDEVFVLLYNINQGAGLAPGNYNNLFRVNYTVADLEPLQDSLKSTFRITHVEGSDYQGLPIDITPSRDLLNVIARNRVSWRGDVNSDGYLDVLDLIMVVDHIVNVDSLNATEFFRADIAPWLPGHSAPVPDGIVNVQELSLIQNIILTGHYPDGTPIGPVAKANYSKYNGDEDAKITLHISKKGIESSINSTIGIRGVQLELSNVESNPGSMIINTDLGRGFFFYVEENKILRTLLYDPLGEKYIEQGEHFLAEMPFTLDKPENVTIEKIVVVDVNREKLEKIQVEIIYSNQVDLPENYALFQNYPNPFNPGTVIEFTLPEDVSNAKLSIYNALGEKVAELVNTSLQAGYHSYYWNAKDFATGMYIYELRTDKFVSVKKMVLVK